MTGQKCESIMRDQDFSHFGLIQLTLPKCCWVLGLSWCCTSLGNIVGMTDELNFNFELYFFLSIFFWPQSALKHSFLGAESSNFAMNGPKNLSKSLYQKDRPFRAIWDLAEKFQIFGILRLPNKFEDLKISSHFILLLNTSSKTICRKKIFGPISVEICCPEKMALND